MSLKKNTKQVEEFADNQVDQIDKDFSQINKDVNMENKDDVTPAANEEKLEEGVAVEKENKPEEMGISKEDPVNMPAMDSSMSKILNDPAVKAEIARQEKILGDKLHEKISEELSRTYKDKIAEIEQKAQDKISAKLVEIQEKNKVELDNQKKFLLEKNASGLIDVLDHFVIAVELIDKNPALANYASGFKMILQMFMTWLGSINIQEIPIKEGDPFDSHIMAAIEKTASPLPVESVVKVIRRGYKMHDKVIRFANVIISSGQNNATTNVPPVSPNMTSGVSNEPTTTQQTKPQRPIWPNPKRE